MKTYTSLLTGALTILTVSCHNNEKAESSAITEEEEIQTVEVITVDKEQPVKHIEVPGELHPWNAAEIFPKIEGFVKEVNADRGTEVKKGQIIATLEAPELISELEEAESMYMAAKAELEQAQAQTYASSLKYQRLKTAAETPGAVAPVELDQALAAAKKDSAALGTAKSNTQAAASAYNTKKGITNYLTIEAPFDGTVVERSISPGDLVGGTKGSTPMFVIQDKSTLRLTVPIPESYAGAMDIKNGVRFSVNSYPDKTFNADFGRSAESVSQNNRVMMVEFDYINDQQRLKPGMFAKVNLPVSRSDSTIFVPSQSVVQSIQDVFVIKVVENKADWTSVETGLTVDTLIEVFGPLQPGDTLVKDASEEIRDGSKLKVQ